MATFQSRVKPKPGTYALVLLCPSERGIEVGRLGTTTFKQGYYIYVGSAFGPGGVAARVKRHCRIDKPVRWHIDYLRTAMTVVEVWFTHDPGHWEHHWAGTLSDSERSNASVSGFGSSDCDCESHLFRFRRRPTLAAFRRELNRAFRDLDDTLWGRRGGGGEQ